MKTGKLAVFVAALLVSATAVQAQTTTTTTTTTRESTWDVRERFSYDTDEGQRFFANEFSFDIFGSWTRQHDDFGDFFTDSDDDTWGAGLGFNYFVTEMIGIGTHATWNDNEGAFVDTLAVDALFRIPIDSISFAPYALGGVGRIFEGDDRWEAHAGIGLEFRLNQFTGIFTDARYLWVEEATDGSQLRFGLRFAF